MLRSRAHKERMRKVGNRRASSGSVVYFIYLCPWLFLAFTFASQSPISMTTAFFICEGGSWLKLCVFIQPTFKKCTLSNRHCAMWPFRSPLFLWFSESVTRSLRCWAVRCCVCKAHNRIPLIQFDSAVSNASPVKGLKTLEPIPCMHILNILKSVYKEHRD